MPDGGGVSDTFRYKIELDSQGLASQLASVRDTVSQGLSQAGRGLVGGGEIVGGAANRLTSDLLAGQQVLAGAFSAQAAMAPMGVATTTLAGLPGMPQTFMQEVSAMAGISRAPVGVFPGQFQSVAAQRLNERAQNAAAAAVSGGVSMAAGTVGAAVGSALIPIPLVGTLVGGLAGSMIGEAAMSPLLSNAQERMADRARIQQVFGWNSFRSEERASMSDFMRQQSVKSIFSPEEFNNVLPAAVKAGFFKGMQRGDVAGFRDRFARAEETLTETMYTMQLSGPEGLQAAGELHRGFRRLGVGDPARAGRMMRESRALAQQMMDIGEYVDPTEVAQRTLEMGQVGAQMGVSPQAMMNTFSAQAATVNRLVGTGQLSTEDIAMLGGSPVEAAQRMTTTLAATQRQPVFKAMALAFGSVDPLSGKAGINAAALEQMGSGRMSFGALSERMSQQLGTGQGGTTKMLTLLANQGKLQGDMMQQQGQMLRGMTDDMLKQAGLEITDGTRQFMMQRVFGVGEAESRALVAGGKMDAEGAARKRLDEEATKVDQEVKGAIQTAQTGVVREFDVFVRGIKDALGKPMDDIFRSIANSLVPEVKNSVERLESIDRRLGNAGYASRSPITSGPIDFSGNDGSWMRPADPMALQGFRAVSESRRYPSPAVSMQVQAQKPGMDPRLVNPNRETMAG